MADNVSITTASAVAVPIAADDIDGVAHQRVKVEFGADGSAADVTSSAGLPVWSGRTLAFASISTASSGDNTIKTAVASNKIKVVSYVLVAAGAVTVRWYSGAAGTALSGAMSLITGVPLVVTNPLGHSLETAVNTALVLNLGGAVQVSGHLTYFTEA